MLSSPDRTGLIRRTHNGFDGHHALQELEVTQIDQKEQVRWYYDHLYRRGRQRETIEFENKIAEIAHNFIKYLQELLNKAFSEVVLFSFQYNH